MPTGRVLLRVTNKHAGRRRRYAQATTRSKTTQHSIHDKVLHGFSKEPIRGPLKFKIRHLENRKIAISQRKTYITTYFKLDDSQSTKYEYF